MVKTNILFIHYGGELIRGSELSLFKILKNINKDKFNVYLIANNRSFVDSARKYCSDAWFTYIPEIMIEVGYYKLEVFKFFKYIGFLCEIIDKYDVKLLYCNSGLPSQAGWFAARKKRIPILSHIRASYNLRYILLYRIYKCDLVIFVSEAIRSQFIRKIKATFNSKVIYNGFDVDTYSKVNCRDEQCRNNLNIKPTDIVIGQVGSLIHRKGLDILINAFFEIRKKCRDAVLVIAGRGADEKSFKQLVQDLQIEDNVRFLGEVSNPQFLYQHVFDINALASRSEALGGTLIEAASCGLPNVGSSVDGIPEVIEDGVTGMIFESENVIDMSEKLLQLVDNPSLRCRMGDAGRVSVLNKFTIANYISSVENTIEALIKT